MNGEIKDSKEIFITNPIYLIVQVKTVLTMQIEAKRPTPSRRFSFPLSDRIRKMPLSISLALSRQINSLFALGVTSCSGGQEVFCTAEAAWQALCMHCEFYIVFNRSGKMFYQVQDCFTQRGKTETEQCWRKYKKPPSTLFCGRDESDDVHVWSSHVSMSALWINSNSNNKKKYINTNYSQKIFTHGK